LRSSNDIGPPKTGALSEVSIAHDDRGLINDVSLPSAVSD
jgi:hypothetical protein